MKIKKAKQFEKIIGMSGIKRFLAFLATGFSGVKRVFCVSGRRKKILFLAGIFVFFAVVLSGVGISRAVSLGQKAIREAETSLRFGAIGDFEYGTRKKVGNKLVSLASSELEKVVNYYNAEWHPVFVVEMGDMVESSGVKQTKALDQFRFIDSVFRKVNARTEYVLGNHDLRSLSKEEVRGILGLSDNHRFFDEGEWRFVIMDTNFDRKSDGAPRGPHHYVSGFVPESEFVWLEQVLDTDRPIILISHHPLYAGGKLTDNYKEVIEFLDRYPNIVLAISGHDPSFRFLEKNGIFHLTVDNLANIDSVGSFATLDARYNPLTKKARVLIEHYGPTRETKEAVRVISGKRPWWVNALERFSLL